MRDQEKTNAQLLDELATTRKRVSELETRLDELHNAKETLEKNNEELLDVWSHTTHELRIPLTSIQGYLELFEKIADRPELKQEFLEKIKQNCKQLSMINQYSIDLQRLMSQRVELNFTNFNFERMLENIVDECQDRIKEDGTSFGYEFSTTLPTWVQGDEKKLWCVLEYLLGNAIEYQDDVITLKVNDPKEKICFEIEMRSPKASKELSFVFVHPAPTQPPPTGSLSLRLSISKLLVGLMGSELTYENREENLNRIDVFWFELSLPEVEAPSEEANI